jgi:hypothetical protein
MSYRVVPNSPLLRHAPASWIAIATADAVHLKGDSITPAMLAHEGTHVKQLREAGGTIRGWMRWIVLLLRHGYDQHPWELEARFVEKGMDERYRGTSLFRVVTSPPDSPHQGSDRGAPASGMQS